MVHDLPVLRAAGRLTMCLVNMLMSAEKALRLLKIPSVSHPARSQGGIAFEHVHICHFAAVPLVQSVVSFQPVRPALRLVVYTTTP